MSTVSLTRSEVSALATEQDSFAAMWFRMADNANTEAEKMMFNIIANNHTETLGFLLDALTQNEGADKMSFEVIDTFEGTETETENESNTTDPTE